MSDRQKLNIFQRGILQKGATLFVYLISITMGVLIIDWLDKRLFIALVQKAQERGSLSLEEARSFVTIIQSRDITIFFSIISAGLAFGFAGWLFMRWAAKRNWSWPVTLSRAVEFKAAMRRLGVVDPVEQIEFVRKRKLPVFIALSPLIQEEHTEVHAKLYAFAHNHSLSDKAVFTHFSGDQMLCLDANDCERLVQENKRSFSLAESVALTTKDRELQSIKETLASLIDDNHCLKAEIETYKEENVRLKDQVKILPAQTAGRVERLRIERLQWAALSPAMERLIKEAPAGRKYTTSELEAAFAEEWKHRVDLRQRMLALTGNEETKPSESMREAVKAEFKDAGLFSTGGRPRKNP